MVEQLLAQAAGNPRWQRWMYLAEGGLADALIEAGDSQAGLALWQRSIARREQVARDDPTSERAQRNVANGYGPLAEALAALGRDEQALHWYQRENDLLHSLRQRHPQVQALAARVDESERDLALQLALVGQVGPGLQRSLAVQQRRASATPDNPVLAAKFALVHARVVWMAQAAAGAGPQPPLSSPRTGQGAAPNPNAARAAATQALALLADAARAEPFNAFLARESAQAHLAMGQALVRAGDAPQGCVWVRSGVQALQALKQARRLPAYAQAIPPSPTGCGETR